MVLFQPKNNEQTDRNIMTGISGANIEFCSILAGSVFTEKWWTNKNGILHMLGNRSSNKHSGTNITYMVHIISIEVQPDYRARIQPDTSTTR